MTDSLSQADRDRALERIKKCMRLSASNEPHEAAAALRQAQKLMQQYAINEDEVHDIDVKSVLVLTPEPPKTRFPLYLSAITSLICRAFDANAIYEVGLTPNGKSRQGVRYFVAGGRAPLVEYAHHVIWQQLSQSWNRYRKTRWDDSQVGERSSFWIGWIAAVDAKITEFGASAKEKETVAKTMNRYAPDSKPAKLQGVVMQDRATRAGFDAAGDFSIHRPMQGASQKLLK